MDKSENDYLLLSQKLAILAAMFNRELIAPILGELSNRQLVEAHEFLWNKLVEFHYLTQKTEFSRQNVTKNMVSSASYQRKQKCDLPLDYCKGVECILSNPDCAGNKIRNNMEVIAKSIKNYLNFSDNNSEFDKGTIFKAKV